MAQIARLRSAQISNGNLINATDIGTELDQLVNESNSQDTRLTSIESGTITFTGNKTFSNNVTINGTTTLAGSLTISGTISLSRASDPSTPADGVIWYNSTSNLFKGQVGGSTKTFATTDTLGFTKGYIGGPAPLYASAATITLPVGLRARNSTNTADIEVSGSNITLSLAVSGAAGLDTGAEASNTWYYVYLIRKSSDGTVSAVFSVTNEAVSGSITFPTGYDQKRQLPIAVRNDGSSNILPFTVAQGWGARPLIIYRDISFDPQTSGGVNALNAGTAATFTDVSLASFVPPISQLADLRLVALDNAGTGDDFVLFRRKGDSTNGIKVYCLQNDHGRVYERHLLATDSSQNIQYNCGGLSGVSAWVNVMGFVVTEVN